MNAFSSTHGIPLKLSCSKCSTPALEATADEGLLFPKPSHTLLHCKFEFSCVTLVTVFNIRKSRFFQNLQTIQSCAGTILGVLNGYFLNLFLNFVLFCLLFFTFYSFTFFTFSPIFAFSPFFYFFTFLLFILFYFISLFSNFSFFPLFFTFFTMFIFFLLLLLVYSTFINCFLYRYF